MQTDFIEVNEPKQREIKSTKKLDFEGENAAFVFQARKPLTKHENKLQERIKYIQVTIEVAKAPEKVIDLSSPIVEHAVNKVEKGKEHMSECQLLEKRLKLENQEMEMMRKRARQHNIEKTKFKRLKAIWEGQTSARSEIPSSAQQFFTWIVPTIKEDRKSTR